MGFAPFTCALGDSPEVVIPCAATVNISPPDDTVDTNRVRITGTGTITSFGQACGGLTGDQGEPQTVTKRVSFVPDASGTITLHHNPPGLSLLGQADRVISANGYGVYSSDADGWWQEQSYSQDGPNASPTQKGGQLLAVNYYTASQTITIPPHATRAWCRMWGGSGASGTGGSDGALAGYFSGGVGAPGYLEKFLTGLTPGNTLVFTRGNGGTPNASLGVGGNGTASTLASGTQTIGTLTAGGSNGSGSAVYYDGATSVDRSAGGSAGGTASGGDLNRPGQSGSASFYILSGNPTLNFGTGGYNSIGRGVDGVNGPGNAGIPGGLIIFWYNDAVA